MSLARKTMALLVSMFLTVACGSAAKASRTCMAEPISDPHVRGRAFSVTFPDGREVLVVGHTHGDRIIPATVFKLVMDESDALKKQEFLRRFNGVVGKNTESVLHANEDYRYLTNLLKQRSDIRLIGIEALEPDLVRIRQAHVMLHEGIRKAMTKHGIRMTPEIERHLRAISGAALYIDIKENELFDGREIRAMETEAGVLGESDAKDLASLKKEFFRDGLISDPELRVNAKQNAFVMKLFIDYHSRAQDPRIFDQIRTLVPLKHQEAAVDWMRSEQRVLAALKRRDVEVAKNLSRSGQSVVHFVGLNHTTSLLNELVEICKNEESPGASARTSTTLAPRVAR